MAMQTIRAALASGMLAVPGSLRRRRATRPRHRRPERAGSPWAPQAARLTGADGVSLTVPPGSLSEPRTLRIARDTTGLSAAIAGRHAPARQGRGLEPHLCDDAARHGLRAARGAAHPHRHGSGGRPGPAGGLAHQSRPRRLGCDAHPEGRERPGGGPHHLVLVLPGRQDHGHRAHAQHAARSARSWRCR